MPRIETIQVNDPQVMDLIPTLWPMMVSAWRGVVLE